MTLNLIKNKKLRSMNNLMRKTTCLKTPDTLFQNLTLTGIKADSKSTSLDATSVIFITTTLVTLKMNMFTLSMTWATTSSPFSQMLRSLEMLRSPLITVALTFTSDTLASLRKETIKAGFGFIERLLMVAECQLHKKSLINLSFCVFSTETPIKQASLNRKMRRVFQRSNLMKACMSILQECLTPIKSNSPKKEEKSWLTGSWSAPDTDAESNSERIRMKRGPAPITLEFINLGLGWDFGLRVGLAVELLGTHRGAGRENIKGLQKMRLRSFVWIMERSIQKVQLIRGFHLILIGSVAKIILLTLPFLTGNENRKTPKCQNATATPATSNAQKTTLWESGPAVETTPLTAAPPALRWTTSPPNGQTRRQRSTSMTSPEDLTLIGPWTERWRSMEGSVEFLGRLRSTHQRIQRRWRSISSDSQWREMSRESLKTRKNRKTKSWEDASTGDAQRLTKKNLTPTRAARLTPVTGTLETQSPRPSSPCGLPTGPAVDRSGMSKAAQEPSTEALMLKPLKPTLRESTTGLTKELRSTSGRRSPRFGERRWKNSAITMKTKFD